jgi:hypothetical protein
MPVQRRNRNRGPRRGPISGNRFHFGSTVPNRLYAVSMPSEMKVAMKYTHFISAVTSIASNYDYMINLNSVYDPDRTGVGHQAMTYDQWSTLYNRYRVDSCNVKVVWGQAPSSGIAVSLLGNNYGAGITDPFQVNESPHKISGVMVGGGSAKTLSKTFNLADIPGVTREVYNADDRYQAVIGNSPTEVIVAHIGTYDMSGSAGAFSAYVEVTYYVTWFDQIIQIPS